MCELITSTLLDSILSIIILLMNIVYVIWSIILPNDDAKEYIKELIEKMKTFKSYLLFSDGDLLLLKIGFIIFIYSSCKKQASSLPNILNSNLSSQNIPEV